MLRTIITLILYCNNIAPHGYLSCTFSLNDYRQNRTFRSISGDNFGWQSRSRNDYNCGRLTFQWYFNASNTHCIDRVDRWFWLNVKISVIMVYRLTVIIVLYWKYLSKYLSNYNKRLMIYEKNKVWINLYFSLKTFFSFKFKHWMIK